MARYMLTGIDDEKWKRFKASCDLMGITIKQALLEYIDITLEQVNSTSGPYKPWPERHKNGRKKK
ncbi:hypothetical protein ES702_06235 [subsurface metagenome]